jgi:hypothetical protein
MSLSTAAKVGIAVAMLIVSSCIFAIVGGIYWTVRNADRVNTATRKAIDDGRRFGQTHAQPECPEEAIRWGARCSSPLCATQSTFFLVQCLQMKERDDALCAGVPGAANANSLRWVRSQCAALGHGSTASCFHVMQTVEGYCNP